MLIRLRLVEGPHALESSGWKHGTPSTMDTHGSLHSNMIYSVHSLSGCSQKDTLRYSYLNLQQFVIRYRHSRPISVGCKLYIKAMDQKKTCSFPFDERGASLNFQPGSFHPTPKPDPSPVSMVYLIQKWSLRIHRWIVIIHKGW